jgi:hypothetical protein
MLKQLRVFEETNEMNNPVSTGTTQVLTGKFNPALFLIPFYKNQ